MSKPGFPVRGLLALLAGGLTTLSFAPLSWLPMAVIGPLLLLLLLQQQRGWQALGLGWLFGFGHFLSGVWWVLISTHVYGGAALPVAIFLLLLLAAYLAFFPALAALLYGRWGRGVSGWLLVWPALWLAADLARNLVLGGFPWFSLGYASSPWPALLKIAPILGVDGLALLCSLLSGVAAWALLKRRLVLPLALVAGLSLLLWFLPAPSAWTQAEGRRLNVSLVQGNISQDQKWQPANLWPTMDLYRELSAQAWPADLVIWPEVAIPAPLHLVQDYFDEMHQQAETAGGTLFATVLTYDDGKPYNTVYALGRDSGRYVKQHLVPFGEYIPVPEWMYPLFDVLDLPLPAIATGLPGDEMLQVDGRPVSLSICFEDVFPLEVRATARHSVLLVNVTNDAWFAGSPAPQQHLQIARLRAAESGRPMLRVANTGISAFIDADGKVRAQLPWGERGVLAVSVQPRAGQTPYQRWGQWPLYVFLMAVGALVLARGRGLLP